MGRCRFCYCGRFAAGGPASGLWRVGLPLLPLFAVVAAVRRGAWGRGQEPRLGGADQREAATLRIGDVAPCAGLASGPFVRCAWARFRLILWFR